MPVEAALYFGTRGMSGRQTLPVSLIFPLAPGKIKA
jgi:hypothetical protein